MKKNDLRKVGTKDSLIEAAESLFARNGIEGVSLRQIGVAAGSQNANVIGYHFGTKQSLIQAIYSYRLPAIDARRRELLDAADRAGTGNDCETLLKAMWLPLYEQKSASNQHTYARFLSCISRDGLGYTRQALDPLYPATNEIASRLRALIGTRSKKALELKLRMQAFMIVGALEYIDLNYADDEAAAYFVFEQTARMAARAITS